VHGCGDVAAESLLSPSLAVMAAGTGLKAAVEEEEGRRVEAGVM